MRKPIATIYDYGHFESFIARIAIVASGILILICAAQIRFSLPWTPVPITAQTFGVTLLSLLCGRRLGTTAVAAYLSLGFAGLPVFSSFSGGFGISPTTGYLIGMLVSSFVIGGAADKGRTKSFLSALSYGFLGSCFVYFFGALILSLYVPWSRVIEFGVAPFLPGDLIKTSTAALLASGLSKRQKGIS